MGLSLHTILSGIVSGSVIAAIIGVFFHRTARKIEQQIRTEFEQRLDVSRSTRAWKERAISELLGPLFLQFERTRRAFDRWSGKNVYLEAKIIKEGNTLIRDLLLSKPHLTPPTLREHAARLVEHYDRWLEEFEVARSGSEPALDQTFVFVGTKGYPFPKESEKEFQQAFHSLWDELYGHGN